MKILIMGLPGSGKSTLAKKLLERLQSNSIAAKWNNADAVRSFFDDWDFSDEGRLRQAYRMANYADSDCKEGLVSICDFVCPTEAYRHAFQKNKKADIIVWMDTVLSSRFEDTNTIFVPPSQYTYRVCKQDSDKWADVIYNAIQSKSLPPKFNSKNSTVQLLGRYQPWHDGHTALFERALEKTGQVCIMVRDCQGWNDNPFDFSFVERGIHAALQDKYAGKYIIQLVPNIVNITYGRDVGYMIEQEDLGEQIHAISATKIRRNMGL